MTKFLWDEYALYRGLHPLHSDIVGYYTNSKYNNKYIHTKYILCHPVMCSTGGFCLSHACPKCLIQVTSEINVKRMIAL